MKYSSIMPQRLSNCFSTLQDFTCSYILFKKSLLLIITGDKERAFTSKYPGWEAERNQLSYQIFTGICISAGCWFSSVFFFVAFRRKPRKWKLFSSIKWSLHKLMFTVAFLGDSCQTAFASTCSRSQWQGSEIKPKHQCGPLYLMGYEIICRRSDIPLAAKFLRVQCS